MLDLGFLTDDIYLLHDPGSRHPESPRRLTAIKEALEKFGADKRWRRIDPRLAHLDELELVHHASLLEHVEKAALRAPAYLDPDTVVSKDSYKTALLAAGGVLACIDAICTGQLRRAFAFVRPPGHHAEADRSMGFCLFNNVALGAAYARAEYNIDRIAVVDIDLHHGNGTQACFYDDPRILYISTHQYPLYPGTGNFDETGLRAGKGYTLNFPLPEGAGDATFVPIYSRIIGPVLDQFQPGLVLVSAGFDAHFKDPLSGLKVTGSGYASAAASLISAADRNCGGRICFVLEGGYSLDALRECSRAVMTEMEISHPHELKISEDRVFQEISQRAKRTFDRSWKW
jgi:acetoin utilization deacetylase AcuC-like enzyme